MNCVIWACLEKELTVLTSKLLFKCSLVCQVWTLPVWQSWNLDTVGAVSIGKLNASFYITSFYRQSDNLSLLRSRISLFLFLLCLIWCPSRSALRWFSLINQQMTNLHWDCSAECFMGVPASTREWHGLAWESGNEVGQGASCSGWQWGVRPTQLFHTCKIIRLAQCLIWGMWFSNYNAKIKKH